MIPTTICAGLVGQAHLRSVGRLTEDWLVYDGLSGMAGITGASLRVVSNSLAD